MLQKAILNPEIQQFIEDNLHADISTLVLKGSPFKNISIQEIVTQIEAKKKCQKKLPTWFAAPKIYYPKTINIAQTSSEKAAAFKANLISGNQLIDISGGFGVDTFYFAKKFAKVTHCEIHKNLSQIVAHNLNALNIKNVHCHTGDGISYLKKINNPIDWVYADPSRRDTNQQKVFLFNDCEPNIPENLNFIYTIAKNILLKTSPLIDITAGLNELIGVKKIIVLAIQNEVKEILWILERNYKNIVTVSSFNITPHETETFSFAYPAEKQAPSQFSKPLTYLYEPNAAILKAGAFNSVGNHYALKKLHTHSHLYTSNTLISFPGRVFKIENVVHYNKKNLKKLQIDKANITTRNFPESVQQLRKKFKIKDGGDNYLFFTTNCDNQKILIQTKKVAPTGAT